MKAESKKELIRTIKFVLFSVSAGIIEISSFSLLYELLGLPYSPSYIISVVLSVLWNFTLNRSFTFQSASNVPKAMLLVAVFYVIFIPASTYVGDYLEGTLLWNGTIVTLLNMVCNFILEYLYDRFIVFRNSIDTNERAKINKK